MIGKLQRRLKDYIEKLRLQLYEILNSGHSDHSVALGFSIGTFVCVLPLFGLHIIICILLALIFKKLNKVALALSVIFWNPLMEFLIYFLSFRIGKYFYTATSVPKFDIVFLNQIYDISIRFILGNLICAVTFSILSYLVIRLALLINRKFVKKEFSDINTNEIKSKESLSNEEEVKIENRENKVEINIVHHDLPTEHQSLDNHNSKKQEYIDISKLHKKRKQ